MCRTTDVVEELKQSKMRIKNEEKKISNTNMTRFFIRFFCKYTLHMCYVLTRIYDGKTFCIANYLRIALLSIFHIICQKLFRIRKCYKKFGLITYAQCIKSFSNTHTTNFTNKISIWIHHFSVRKKKKIGTRTNYSN